MSFEPDKNLERLIQEELQKLPDLHAPRTLIPRVNARIRASARRAEGLAPWRNWPLTGKCLSVSCFVLLLAGLIASLGGVNVAAWAESFRSGATWLVDTWQTLAAALNAGLTVSRALSEHVLIWAGLIFGFVTVVTIAAGSGLWRLTFSEQQQG